MTNLISIRLANGTNYEWAVSNPSDEQIDLLPIVLNALDSNNDSLVDGVTPETVTDLADSKLTNFVAGVDNLSDNEILRNLVKALSSDFYCSAVIEYGENSHLCYFGEGEIAVSIQSGLAIPVFSSDKATEKLEEVAGCEMSEDVSFEIDGHSLTVSIPISRVIEQYGDIDDVYNAVFPEYEEQWLVEHYTYDTNGFVVREFTRELSVSDFS
jgi:hypothetical protein